MLILNANGCAAELIRQADRRDIHFALLQGLGFGQFCLLILSPLEFHALFEKPSKDFARFGVGDLLHGSEKSGLAEAFFEKTRRVKEFIGNDRIEHSHATFVENAQDRFLLLQLTRGVFADLFLFVWKPSVRHVSALYAFAFSTPFVIYLLYFLALGLTGGVVWRIHMWLGASFLAGVVGLGLSVLVAPPVVPAQ